MKIDKLKQFVALRKALEQEKAQIELKLQRINEALTLTGPPTVATSRGTTRPQNQRPTKGAGGAKSQLSAAARAKISAAAKARWAKFRAAKRPAASVKPAPKRKVSAATRAKIAAIARARWAKIKAAKGNSLKAS